MFHNLAVPVLHLFIELSNFYLFYVDELKKNDDPVTSVCCAVIDFCH